ncbi:MAG: PD40 domain-containing protein [Caldilineaceae bacterium]|nr:PD40 domain-containing protein [Caldilineaceae bacterium]
MRKVEQNNQFWALLTLISFAVFFFSVLPQQLWAQSDTPPVLPIPADDELIVVAGGQDAMIYAADGTVVATAAAGDQLVASARSADDSWLLVRTADDREGWAQRGALLVFDRMTLPMIDLDVTAMTQAAASATATAEEMAASATEVTTDTTENIPAVALTEPTVAVTAEPTTTATMAEQTVSALVRTGSERLNVRGGPGVTYPVVGKAANGETLSVIGRNADQSWLQVTLDQADGGFGWVATQFVAVTEPLGGLPVADAVNSDMAATMVQSTGAHSATVADSSGAAATRSQPTGLQGKLVLLDHNGGTIYLYHLATGALQRLTAGNDPALSPDGTQVVFTRGGGENGIYLINVDGSNEHQIFGERELLRSPKWSPDGRWIVFSRGDEFNRCYLDKDTGECLRSNPFFTEGFEKGKDHVRKLARVDVNGDNYRDLAVVPDAFAPDWSSAGVVYQSAAGLQITQDTPEDQNRLLYFDIHRQYHQDPDWQPSGGRVVFQQRQGSHYEIFGINPYGSGLTALTRPATTLVDQLPSNVSPAWSPDGQSIVFLSNRTADHEAGPWQLWVMNADGSNQRPLPVNLSLHYDYALEQMVDWGP